jgi:hypothetical protein
MNAFVSGRPISRAPFKAAKALGLTSSLLAQADKVIE